MDVDGGLSMSARVEITKKYATAHRKAVKKDKGHIQDTPNTVGPNGGCQSYPNPKTHQFQQQTDPTRLTDIPCRNLSSGGGFGGNFVLLPSSVLVIDGD